MHTWMSWGLKCACHVLVLASGRTSAKETPPFKPEHHFAAISLRICSSLC